MSDLFKKLNTLVRASLNDLNPIRRSALPMDVDAQIKDLRERINAAVEHEEHLAETVRILRADADRLDTKVDQAVADGHEDQARLLLEDFQRARKKLDSAEADLKAHQDAAQMLIERVNMLDAAVSEARNIKEGDEQEDSPTAQRISDLLRETRERISGVTDRINAYFEQDSPSSPVRSQPEPKPTSDDSQDDYNADDDLADRLKRLSK